MGTQVENYVPVKQLEREAGRDFDTGLYEKPKIVRKEGITFPFDVLKSHADKGGIKTYECKQCSSCHNCR